MTSSGNGSGRLAYMPKPGDVVYQNYDLPDPAPGDMLVRTLVAGVCGSELHIFRGSHAVLKSVALGHEIVGAVDRLGEGAETDSNGVPLQVGDAVSISYLETCGSCRACSLGKFEFCQHKLDKWLRPPMDAPHFVGTMATHYYASAKQAVFKLPACVSPIAAASANCALAQVVHAVEKASIRPGDSVVVQGAGGLGLYFTALAKECGARVLVIDQVEARLEKARAFGAGDVLNINEVTSVPDRRAAVAAWAGKDGADVVADLTGNTAAFAEGVELVGAGGRFIEVGIVLPGVQASFDLGSVARRGVLIATVVHYAPRHLAEALAFLSRSVDRLPLDSLIDATYALDDVEQAISDAERRLVSRAAIVPHGAV